MRGSVPAWIICIVAVCAVRTVDAQATQLTLDEAVARALAANPDRSAVELAEAQLERSRALAPSNPVFGAGAQKTSQSGIQNNFLFFLQQEVEVGGQRTKRIEAATEGVAEKDWEHKSAQQNLAATVKSTFVHVLVSAARITLAHQGLDAARDLSEQLARRKRLTDLQRIELNIAQIQESRARRYLKASERQRKDNLGTLRRLIGSPPEQSIELVGSPQSEIKEIPPPAELIERAKQQRPDLISLRHAAQRGELQVAVEERQKIPNVTLLGEYSRFQGDYLLGGDISFPLPVFQRGTADVLEAVAERSRTSREVEKLEHEIAAEVSEAHRAYAAAAFDLALFQTEILPKSEENVEIERALYERNEVTASDLNGLQADLLNARGEHLDALEAYNDALIELERVVGGKLDGPS
jgi:outer membrane protein, heavy metal efflux system